MSSNASSVVARSAVEAQPQVEHRVPAHLATNSTGSENWYRHRLLCDPTPSNPMRSRRRPGMGSCWYPVSCSTCSVFSTRRNTSLLAEKFQNTPTPQRASASLISTSRIHHPTCLPDKPWSVRSSRLQSLPHPWARHGPPRTSRPLHHPHPHSHWRSPTL